MGVAHAVVTHACAMSVVCANSPSCKKRAKKISSNFEAIRRRASAQWQMVGDTPQHIESAATGQPCEA